VRLERRGASTTCLSGLMKLIARRRIILRSREQQIGQRLEARLFGYLRLGAALRLEGR